MKRIEQPELERAAEALRRGEIVCIPTETSYGLAADTGNAEAVEAVAAAKGRGEMAPFATIAADLEQARSLAAAWPEAAGKLAARHWPGPLTLVVPAAAGLPARLVGAGGGVGVRVSSHPAPTALAALLGRPITATSANVSGAPAATTVAEARAALGDRVAVYLDAGDAPGGPPSTLVAVSAGGGLTLLRAGPIDLSGVCGT